MIGDGEQLHMIVTFPESILVRLEAEATVRGVTKDELVVEAVMASLFGLVTE